MATYRVTNTRNVPKGTRILEYEGKDYFECRWSAKMSG